MDSFKFEMNSIVALDQSGQRGRVVGQAIYENGSKSYLLRYQDAKGDAVECWWVEGALIAA